MFDFFKKKEPEICEKLNNIYPKLKEIYNFSSISDEKKRFLEEKINKFGYLNISYQKALNTLSNCEILYGIELKLKKNKIYDGKNFIFKSEDMSPSKRFGYNNSTWFNKEQHNIKLINLAALKDGNKTKETGIFIDWLRQILILPSGKEDCGVLSTTIYLTPFHPREFECSYIIQSFKPDKKLNSKELEENLGLNVEEQIKLFIQLAQLCGHSVIYDILPQIGRFSDIVLANPFCVRWFNVNSLSNSLKAYVDTISLDKEIEADEEDINFVKDMYKKTLCSQIDDLSDFYLKIYNLIDKKVFEKKKEFSEIMLSKSSQDQIQKDVKNLIEKTNGIKIKSENDINNHGQIVEKLIEKGYWTAPGGAWNSCGIPIFDGIPQMCEYPVFKHFDCKQKDVSDLANLDCQSPYYFMFLDYDQPNKKVIEFFISEIKRLQKYYGFDGFRMDHTDHIIDECSINKKNSPISYRIPDFVLSELNNELKKNNPNFVMLAEYMLGGNYLSEYHKKMGFDCLWGNDIPAQDEKIPSTIIEDNQELANYNITINDNKFLSILKTYNNQDGEFPAIDRFPAQMGRNGAMFKWFKYKFLSGGKYANRPVLFVDDDESFTKTGIEFVIDNEVSMKRANDEEFFEKFDAINRFALQNELCRNGEAQIIKDDEDGFCAWLISKEPIKESLLIVANYLSENYQNPNENESDNCVYNKKVQMPCDYTIISEYVFENGDFNENKFEKRQEISFDKLNPSEFRIYKVLK